MDIIAGLLGEWSEGFNTYSCLLRIVLATLVAMAVGIERSTKFHSAGMKTFITVSLASTLGALGDVYLSEVKGVGIVFLCPAVIIGIAIIGTNTIIAMMIGYGLYFVGILAFAIFMLVILFFPKLEKKIKSKSIYLEAHIEFKSRESLQVFTNSIRQFGLKINDIEINPAYANSGLAVYSISMKIANPELRKKSHKEIMEMLSAMETVNYIEEIF